MRKNNTLFLSILTILGLFILSACGGGNGYTFQPWEFNRDEAQTAQEAPGQISDLSDLAKTQQGQTPQGPQVSGPQTQIPQGSYTPAIPSNLPPVKVGLLLPLSGKHQELGQALLQSAQMALFDIGYDAFELMPRDTKGTPDGARQAAKSALADGAQLILGPVFADSVRAVKEATSSSKVSVIAFSTNWSLAGGNTYIMGFLPFDQIERILGYAGHNNLNRIAILAPNSEYGRVVTSSTTSIAPQIGLQIIKNRTFPENNSNLSSVVREFSGYAEQNPQAPISQPKPFDAVFMPVGGESAIAIAGLLSEYGLQPNEVRRLGTGLFDDMSLASESSLSGGLFAAPSPNLRADFERRFRTTYGYVPPRLSTLAYDATALAAVLAERGLRASGRPAFDRESISNPNGFAGIDGIFRFRPNGTAERGLAVLEFRNGQIRIVEDAPKTFQQYRPF